jgi:hypothetical protein
VITSCAEAVKKSLTKRAHCIVFAAVALIIINSFDSSRDGRREEVDKVGERESNAKCGCCRCMHASIIGASE